MTWSKITPRFLAVVQEDKVRMLSDNLDFRCLFRFFLGVQLDVIHVEQVADGGSALELKFMPTLCDYLTEGVQTYAARIVNHFGKCRT